MCKKLHKGPKCEDTDSDVDIESGFLQAMRTLVPNPVAKVVNESEREGPRVQPVSSNESPSYNARIFSTASKAPLEKMNNTNLKKNEKKRKRDAELQTPTRSSEALTVSSEAPSVTKVRWAPTGPRLAAPMPTSKEQIVRVVMLLIILSGMASAGYLDEGNTTLAFGLMGIVGVLVGVEVCFGLKQGGNEK